MEFTPWPKTPRLFRDAVITEKIDGTNAAVIVEPIREDEYDVTWTGPDGQPDDLYVTRDDHAVLARVGAQSRSRIITPEADNFGFARWVQEHAQALARTLGPGTHFGEWWGSGIQRGYGLTNGDKRFSLFNVHRYARAVEGSTVPGLGVVPVLSQHTFSTELVRDTLADLAALGSRAAPGFDRPEGVVVFHSQSRSVFKALLDNDHLPKGA